MLAAKCHLGTKSISNNMKSYVFSRRADGLHIIHLGKTWEKLMLAARVLAIIEPEDIYITFSTSKSRRPAIKLAKYVGGKTNQDRFVPGTFTNTLEESTMLVCMDPMTDFQAVQESSKCNMPVIAFTNTHSLLKYVDLAIPCNNMGSQSLGVMCWFLSRAILRIRGILNYNLSWDVLPDMFFYSDIQEDDEQEGHTQEHPYEPLRKPETWNAPVPFTSNQGGFHYEMQDTANSWSQDVLNQEVPPSFELGNWADGFTTPEQKHRFELPGVPLNDWALDTPEGQEQQEEGWGNESFNNASTSFTPSKTPWDD